MVEDADGRAVMNGLAEMRERYGTLFATMLGVRAEIVSRMHVGSYVVDEEHVLGGPDGDVHAIATYRLDADGLIDLVRFLH